MYDINAITWISLAVSPHRLLSNQLVHLCVWSFYLSLSLTLMQNNHTYIYVRFFLWHSENRDILCVCLVIFRNRGKIRKGRTRTTREIKGMENYIVIVLVPALLGFVQAVYMENLTYFFILSILQLKFELLHFFLFNFVWSRDSTDSLAKHFNFPAFINPYNIYSAGDVRPFNCITLICCISTWYFLPSCCYYDLLFRFELV